VLIYNHEKSLIGMDDETLHHLGFETIDAFLEQHSDVAELFVKKPGYIHNFKNFPWIDFVIHAESEDSHAIIETDTRSFSCALEITPFLLTSSPEQEGFAVYFKHIKSISGASIGDFTQKPEKQILDIDMQDDSTVTEFDSITNIEETVLKEPDTLDIPDTFSIPDTSADDSLFAVPSTDFELDTSSNLQLNEIELGSPMLGDYVNQGDQSLVNLDTDDDYIFDPSIASEELGLPVELINEFIGDFIKQTHEFRPQLHEAMLKEDYDEVHVLSHKLKGVAANLRIEDAFETLAIINSSVDQDEIEAHLGKLDSIIAKMEGKPVAAQKQDNQNSLTTDSDADSEVDLDLDNDDIYDIGALLGGDSDTSKADNKTADLEDLNELELSEPEMQIDDDSLQLSGDLELNDDTLQMPDELSIDETIKNDISMDEISIDDISSDTKASNNADTDQQTTLQLNYDVDKAAEELGIGAKFVTTLIEDFKQEALKHKDELTQAIDTEDFLHVKRVVFPFKGLADNLRIIEISKSISNLIAHNNKDLAAQESTNFYQLLEQL